MIITCQEKLEVGSIRTAPLTSNPLQPRIVMTAMVMREASYQEYVDYWKSHGAPESRLELAIGQNFYEIHTD